jgi:hypothetical protein
MTTAISAAHLRYWTTKQDAVEQYYSRLQATKKNKHAIRAKYMSTEQDEAHA